LTCVVNPVFFIIFFQLLSITYVFIAHDVWANTQLNSYMQLITRILINFSFLLLNFKFPARRLNPSEVTPTTQKTVQACLNVKSDRCWAGRQAISFFFFLFPLPPCGPELPHYRDFTITPRHTTVGRTPLDG